eukprot:gnl/TRDRNA2_/TRDRNA2_80889_c0_seq1.p1 gnl/TRDRNA2_/TRDRNA2_80889_c0~~gnl/TRDRNA2_/TRDRNA2_80889_c0_seq1.p1  ORF type:complete len:585 (+),score=72.72 gnl/TRDRNA2_/TRDRNA2_80889_c0_seq1:117-1871(+)
MTWPACITRGDAVEVFGLDTEAGKKINGQVGTVTNYLPDRERFEVRLSSTRVITVRPNNVMKLHETDQKHPSGVNQKHPSGVIEPGDRVEVFGMESAGRELNGQIGTVISVQDNGRYELRLSPDKTAFVRPLNVMKIRGGVPRPLCEGDVVDVLGLATEANKSFNGNRGVVVKSSGDDGRTEVRLSSDRVLSVKAGNLKRLAVAPGDIVEVSGLWTPNGQEMNGKKGTVERYVLETGRFKVMFPSRKQVSVKPENLTKVESTLPLNGNGVDKLLRRSTGPSSGQGSSTFEWTAAGIPRPPRPSLPRRSTLSLDHPGLTVSGKVSQGLEAGELHIGSDPFDPVASASLRSQLTTKLGVSKDCTIEALKGRGGLNEGIWILSAGTKRPTSLAKDREEELVLKLSKCTRSAPIFPTEAENCIDIASEYPGIVNDPSLAFPIKVFSCIGVAGAKRYDLLVMRKVKGQDLGDVMHFKWYNKNIPELMKILEKLGACLARFHAKYNNKQHGDLQPSNIFYDEDSGSIILIDLGGMGVPSTETDIEHFSRSLLLLSETYGASLAVDGRRHLLAGYTTPESTPEPFPRKITM